MVQVIFRSGNCSKHTDEENYLFLWSRYMPFTYAEICLNATNLILNLLSLVIFSIDKSEDRQVRFSLRLLSLTEVMLAISKQHYVIFLLMRSTSLSYDSALVLAYFLDSLETMQNILLCSRNSLLALIHVLERK